MHHTKEELRGWTRGEIVDEIQALEMEALNLHRRLSEAKQYNDLFRRCTRRALDIWLERHPGVKMWPDTAKNICWLAEENERLRKALGGYADRGNWFRIRDEEGFGWDVYTGHPDNEKAYTRAERALEIVERNE